MKWFLYQQLTKIMETVEFFKKIIQVIIKNQNIKSEGKTLEPKEECSDIKEVYVIACPVLS